MIGDLIHLPAALIDRGTVVDLAQQLLAGLFTGVVLAIANRAYQAWRRRRQRIRSELSAEIAATGMPVKDLPFRARLAIHRQLASLRAEIEHRIAAETSVDPGDVRKVAHQILADSVADTTAEYLIRSWLGRWIHVTRITRYLRKQALMQAMKLSRPDISLAGVETA